MALSNLTEIGRRALQTYQIRLATTGQNMANVETKGYSRREVTVAAAPGVMSPYGQIGSGVDTAHIRRVRDQFLDQSMRQENPALGYHKARRDALARIEGVFNEPSDASLNHALSQMFVSFQALTDDPENLGARTTVLGAAQNVSSTLNRLSRQIDDMREDLLGSVREQVSRINEVTEQIAGLNRSIAGLERVHGEASDERDRRDLLVDELSRLIDTRAQELPDGTVTVESGGKILVHQDRSSALKLRIAEIGGNPVAHVVVSDTDQALTLESGSLQGLLSIREQTLNEYKGYLDEIAVKLVEEVNRTHRSGYGLDGVSGRDFFSPTVTGAKDIAVDRGVVANVRTIAASLDGSSGDNRNALELAGIERRTVTRDASMTLLQSYHALIGDLGAKSRLAQDMAETQNLVVSKLENDRLAVSGVSLDEETARLISGQKAYQAAARLVRASDEMAETLLNMLR